MVQLLQLEELVWLQKKCDLQLNCFNAGRLALKVGGGLAMVATWLANAPREEWHDSMYTVCIQGSPFTINLWIVFFKKIDSYICQ